MDTKVVLFDLDGTLLPMDQDIFVKAYFGGIAKRLAAHGYEPEKLINSILLGTKAMIQNDGQKTNEGVFWDTFSAIYGQKARLDEPYFDAFYRENFDDVQCACGYTPKAVQAVSAVKSLGFRIALATNPIFPAIATQKRMQWAGLSQGDFELVTTYENARYCKPNLNYYLDIADKLGVSPQECLMVGNDVGEDMVAAELGMETYLVTRDLINRSGADISTLRKGKLDGVLDYLDELERA